MNKRGFTLVELMIVVVILGILAAITIPNFVTMVGRAREASTKKKRAPSKAKRAGRPSTKDLA